MTTKWWGWGEESKSFDLADADRFWKYLQQRLGETRLTPCIALDEIALRPPRLDVAALQELGKAAGGVEVDSGKEARVRRSLGKGYRDLVRLRRGDIPKPTDAVVLPRTNQQVAVLIEAAARRGIAIIPFGGGTTVVGGVEVIDDRPTITLDLGRMARVLRIDQVSHTATVEAGILGPALEAQLRGAGFTLGHFPQSFEYSALGGWIATRSAGQNSTLYGKIEERVEALRMLFPGGEITTPPVPAAAAGPDLNQVIAGSEGVLGVITEATVRLAPLPAVTDYRGFLLPTFAEGVEVARAVMQSGLKPALLRLSDEPETEAMALMQLGAEGLNAGLLMLGFAGDEEGVRSDWSRAEHILSSHGAQPLGSGIGEGWERSRFEMPYLRDILLDHGVMVDTLETATTWDRYCSLHGAVRDAMRAAMGDRCIVMAHLSHAYEDGASVYYTFMAVQELGAELEQWQRAKDAATQAIVDGGGALSHHHGIGFEHRRWMAGYAGRGGLLALAALKKELDPDGVMNPGKLMPTMGEV